MRCNRIDVTLACCHRPLTSLFLCGLALHWLLAINSQAQGTAPITSSGLQTQVSAPSTLPNGTIQYSITGGTRPGSGPNLFHSFGEFGIPANNIANFLNETALPTSNILGRVTGGNPSNIFGTIQTTGFGGANLFLMNPAGILFGPNASLNVGGSASFTTADYLRLSDGTRFNAIPGPQDASISSAPIAAFGFLGTNQAAITVQGGHLAVSEEQAISLVGGDITIEGSLLAPNNVQPGGIFAAGGQINLVSVASPGEILSSTLQFAPNVNAESFTQMGNISITGGSILDVSGDAAGTVKIRGGQLVLHNATLSVDTVNANGAPIGIDIDVTGGVRISSDTAPALTARTTGNGNAGAIQISSASFDAIGSSANSFLTLIDSHTSGSGRGGNVQLTTRNLIVSGDPSAPPLFIDSGTGGEGRGGDVTITAGSALFSNAGINTGDSILPGVGSGGDLSIKVDSLRLETISFGTDSLNARAGNLNLDARGDLVITGNSSIGSLSLEGQNSIAVAADKFVMNDSSAILSQTALGSGEGVTITARHVELSNGGRIASQTFGDGVAGGIGITATERVIFSDSAETSSPSGLFTNSFGDAGLGDTGRAGSITVNTPILEMIGGARINSATQSSGRGGDVTIASDRVSISGGAAFDIQGEVFGAIPNRASGVYSSTVGSQFCSGPCGDAGNISITTGSLLLSNGGTLDSGTVNTGRGGSITVHGLDLISLSGTLNDGTPTGLFSRALGNSVDSGTGGNISLRAGQSVSLSNGAFISASSTGPSNAGNISINAGAQFLSQNATVTTQADQASGGNIVIQATDSIRLINSQLSTSVHGGPNTAGGNITLDPAVVTLQNSQVTAQAFQGQGGNISIIAGTFLADQTSLVSASSQFGVSGSVDIQSPVSNLSGTLATLAQRPLQAQPLLTQRCAAQLNGQLSSLVVAGRDTFPTEPGGWLMSPLAMMTGDESAAQARVTATLAVEASQPIEEHMGPGSEQRDWSLPRGVTDRAAGCGS